MNDREAYKKMIKEYNSTINRLRSKIVKSNGLTNRQKGYNDGIRSAMSIISSSRKALENKLCEEAE